MRRHWRWGLWVLMWLVPVPFVPDVVPLYWLALFLIGAWAFRVELVLEPRWTMDEELERLLHG